MRETAADRRVPAAEMAAALAAIERFRSDHAPVTAPAPAPQSPWLRAALLEGTGRTDDVAYGSGLR